MNLGLWRRFVGRIGCGVLCVTATFAIGVTTMVGSAAGADVLTKRASWEPPTQRGTVEAFRRSLDELHVGGETAEGLTRRLADAVGDGEALLDTRSQDPLDLFVTLAAEVSDLVRELRRDAADDLLAVASRIDPSGPAYAAFETLPEFIRMSFRGWLGRELVQRRFYDEALPILAEVKPAAGLDPAAVLFYRGVCYHALLMKDEALADLRRLLEQPDAAPSRFTRTAELMVADLQPLEEDSLDEISRLMTDVTRRLDLGRADEQVKDQEQAIIDKLTKLIDKIEEQQQQQQQQQQQAQSQGGGGQGTPGSPMQDSQIGGASGAGDVDRKNIAQRDGWGNLPPAERRETLQQLGQDLPTHYREAIEAYFRKLATDGQR